MDAVTVKRSLFAAGYIIAFLLVFTPTGNASASSYYVCNSASTCNANSSGWSTGSDSNTCTSKGTACLSLRGAMSKMSGGDTVVIGDGTYSGTSNSVDSSTYPPYGSSSAWTIIKAEHDGGVTFNGSSFILDYTSGNRAYYYQLEGLVWSNATFWVSFGHHVKVLRCGGYNAGAGNVEQFGASEGSSYILFEDCYAWGEARYKFLAWKASQVIFRRCVGRLDKEDAQGQNIAGMAMYSTTDGLVQNSIVVDMDTPSYWTNVSYYNGCFVVPVTVYPGHNVTFDGNICLNSKMGGLWEESYDGSNKSYDTTIRNNVFWDTPQMDNNEWVNSTRGVNPTWTNNTFGVAHLGEAYLSMYKSSNGSVTNNLFYDINTAGVVLSHWDIYGTAHDYNTYYASTGLPTLSAHEYTNKNPIWNASTNPTGALKYITRVETGSNHSGIGSGGADIGANVVKRVGASGTLWGEAGYDVEQAESLWPFPNEDIIKAKMASYSYSGLTGARGFAASGNGLYGGPITLTSYIWEYLGNPCPTGICTAASSDTTPPASPADLAANATSESSITVSWTAATDNVGVTGYQVERCVGLSCSDFAQVGTPTASPFVDSNLAASTGYSYHVRAVDAAGNISGWSNVVGATTQAAAVQAPTVTFSASPTSITSGSSSTLTWSSANATSCTASASWSGVKTTSGTQSVSPTSTSTYTLSCTGAGGTTSKSTTVTVTSGGSVGSSSPTLFFSDIESGPKTGGENNNGAFVTLYGSNFGTNPTVTVGGGQAIIKLQPSDYLWYQKMTIQLGANAATGDIMVTNSSGSSNGIPFTVRSGTIRFVGGSSGDYASILACRTAMSAGDICYVRSGYGTTGTENYTASVVLGSPGTASNPMALLVYPGASVTIGTSARARGIYFCATYSSCSNGSYWVVSGFNIIGISAVDAIEVGNLRIVGNDITCPAGTGRTGCVEVENTSNTEFFGNHVHDNAVAPGSKYYHHMYYSDDSNNAEVGWNDIGIGYANRCVQFYSGVGTSHDLSVHDNYIHDCVGDGINFQTVNAGSGAVQAYNNLIVRAGTGPLHPEGSSNYACIFASGSDNGTVEIFNNTLYDCGSFTSYGNGALNPEVHVRLRNNAIYQLTGEDYLEQNASLVSGSNNVWYGVGNGPTQTTGNINANPQFVSAGSDFHLSVSSPAIDSGTSISALTLDMDGNHRPQGSAYDIGAYEYGESAPSSTPQSCSIVTSSNFADSTYTGYGAPYDVFSNNTPLISTTCTSSDTHTINATFGITGDTTRIVYTKGYYYDPGISDWSSFTGTCTGALNGDWCQGSVSTTITDTDISTASAADPAYLVGMTCSIQGGKWKCGCRDTTCSTFYWQVQGAGM